MELPPGWSHRPATLDDVPAILDLMVASDIAENLAVRRAYRGRGIARALLSTAFAEYANKGRVRAGLGVDLTNPTGAYDLYRSVGMYPAFEADMYERSVPAPA
jgi:GNAT superfamily N-acetyltransferase